MNFKILKNPGSDGRAMNGYRFIGSHCEKNESAKSMSENEWSDAVDSFYDGYSPICEGEDGNLYSVEFAWVGIPIKAIPMIWQRVEAVNKHE